ncbi:MAG: hypothetical protein LIO62_03715 [Clostridiales bacterium]|nr:hypothetical protein [Clostridiales bacterium]
MTVIIFFVCFSLVKSDIPFTGEVVNVAEYQSGEITSPQYDENIMSDDGTVLKSAIVQSENTQLGTVTFGGDTFDLIYEADSVNAVGRTNLSSNGAYVGEIGTAVISINKSNNAKLNMLAKGDDIEIECFYGSYTYEVTDVVTVDTFSQIFSAGDGIGRAVAIYTDDGLTPGLSENYRVVIAKMTSGTEVNE